MSIDSNLNKINAFIDYPKLVFDNYEINTDLTISRLNNPLRQTDKYPSISQIDVLKLSLNYLDAISERLSKKGEMTSEIQAKIKKTEEKIHELIKGSATNSDQTIKKSNLNNEDKIIEKIKAIRKGIGERNNLIIPKQIKNIIKNKIGGEVTPEQLDRISLRICREINELTTNEHSVNKVRFLKGESLQNFHNGHILTNNVFDKNGKKIANIDDPLTSSLYKKLLDAGIDISKLPKREKEGKDNFALDFDFSIKFFKESKNVKLTMIPKENALLGNGAYKSIFKQESFLIPLKLERAPGQLYGRTRNMTYCPEVLQKAYFSKAKEIRNGLSMMQKIIQAVKREQEESQTALAIASLPKELIEEDKDYVYFEQERYSSDIKILSGKEVIEDFEGKKIRNLKLFDKFNVILSSADALEKIHQAGFVHRDIKPDNIFTKVNEKKLLEGYVADFDLAEKIGQTKEKKGTFGFMDQCALNELVIPYTDLFALATSLSKILKDPNSLKFNFLQSLNDAPDSKEGRLKSKIKELTPYEITKMDADSSEHPEKLKELQAEIQAFIKAKMLIKEILEYNSKIYKFILADNHLMISLRSQDDQEIKAGLARLYQKYPHASDSYFISELRKIQSSLSQTY